MLGGTELRRIVLDGDAAVLVAEARSFGLESYQGGLTKSQIRGVFGAVRQIQARWDKSSPGENLRKVLLLKPRLAYQKARQAKVGPLADVLSSAIDLVAAAPDAAAQKQRFGYFVDLFEAILAYHTAAGGK